MVLLAIPFHTEIKVTLSILEEYNDVVISILNTGIDIAKLELNYLR
jgi:predicted dinucleotide-binding enzyme